MNDRTKEWAACTDAASDAFRAGDHGAFALAVARLEVLIETIDGPNAPEIISALGDGFWMGVLGSARELPMGWRRDSHGFYARHERVAIRTDESNTAEELH